MTKPNIDHLLAEFAARGGTVKKIAEGERSLDLTDREWAQRVRQPRQSEEDRLIAERHYVIGSNGVEHCRNGLGEWLY